MLRRAIFLLLFLLVFAHPARAIYEPTSVPNNKYGILVLETSEIERAAELVNSSGGSWGYVSIPIRSNERDLVKWTKFMNDCQKFKIIPILRIASFPVGDHWMAPNEYDLVDFANFLDELPWPTKNRYVVVYNEPNHEGEWGGFVNPSEYARVLDRAVDIFHTRNSDFFIISAGMDASAPNGSKSMSAFDYERTMDNAWPGIFDRVDGLSFHAYGNPGFSTYPNIYSKVNIASYRYEYSFSEAKPIFITEAGWRADLLGDSATLNFYRQAFLNIWVENDIVAITPFLLDAQTEPFSGFSFVNSDGKLKDFAQQIKFLPKVEGKPQVAEKKTQNDAKISPTWTGNLPRILNTDLIGFYLAGFLRTLMGAK